jgi:hypothetical protein
MDSRVPDRPLHVIVEAAGGFALSFEDAAAALESLDRLFLEPDGSFVWTGESDDDAYPASGHRWQLDGELYDRDGRLAYVVVKGSVPREQLEELWRALGWPNARLTFQLVREGITLDESQFRQWLGAK